MMTSKSYLRKVILQYRMLMDGFLYAQRNDQLCNLVCEFVGENRIRKLHTFLSIQKNQEPDISGLLDAFWTQDIQVVVSKTDFLFKQMRHYHLTRTTILEKNAKGIPEPVEANETSIDDLDMIFVPLLISDKHGYRIGYGGGYYDRLLSETKALKVGLSLSPPVDMLVQKEEWDIPLDYLITPFKIYNYG